MAMANVDGCSLSRTHNPSPLAWSEGRGYTWSCMCSHQMNQINNQKDHATKNSGIGKNIRNN